MNFNYIVTIHNSRWHLKKVLKALFAVKGKDSRVFCVLDGCTDGSERIVDKFGCQKIFTPDIRETLAINAALKAVPQDGYNIILQDDVLMLDKDTERKILELYRRFPDLGVVSFRHGGNLEPGTLDNGKPVPETDLIQSAWQPWLRNVPLLADGYATFRQVVYKSPICISSEVVNKLGGYDERFAPNAHDDTEYCIRAHKAGLRNAVVALKVDQPLKWGGTRRHKRQPKDLHAEHMDLLRRLYPAQIGYLSSNHPSSDQIRLW